MKKLFYAVVALSLFATSCAKESAEAPEATGKTKRVTFSIKAPEMQVRSGEGASANIFYYAFYDEDGILVDYTNVFPPEGEDLAGDTWSGTAGTSVDVTLVEGKTYHAIFWAHSSKVDNDIEGGAKLYIPDWENKTVSFNFDKTFPTVGNAECYDAFYAYVGEITTANPKNEETILMKRPFAQLNIAPAFSDIDAAGKAGVSVQSVAAVATVPTKLNLVTGEVSDEKKVLLGWTSAGAGDFKYNDTQFLVYFYCYILAGAGVTDKQLTTVDFLMSEKPYAAGETFSDAITRTFTAVPIQRNHRTYILGDIVTSSEGKINYVVKVAPGFDNEGNPTIDQE